jgi:hypothetical protein
MPIRFDSGTDNKNAKRGEGKNKWGILALLSLVIFFLFRRPKFTIPILIIVGLVYYFFFLGGNKNLMALGTGKFGMGCGFDQTKYDNIKVYEPLASSSNKNKIPASFSLYNYAPKRKDQGAQGSCVGWATAYAARTVLEAYATGKDPNSIAFSPSFLYNQVAKPGCNGAYTSDALEIMATKGSLPWAKFDYDENSCSKKPNANQLSEAKQYKIIGYNRLSKTGNDYDVSLEALKQNIAQGAPVILAMKVPESFNDLDKELWEPTKKDYKYIEFLGGHAMCAIGYDDFKFGGAVQIMNSWGRNWGSDGVFWMRYTDFEKFIREAYCLFPLPKKTEVEFDVSFGLVHAASNAEIPLNQYRANLFRTRSPLKKNDKFKIEVQNNVPCYIYVFGQETDGSSFVLFPYKDTKKSKSKYSAYCGITGARHFPSGVESLKTDEVGSQDFMAVVVSKDELDYKELNERINRIPGKDYLSRLNKAMGAMQISNPKFKLKASSVAFQGKTSGNQKAVAVVIAIDKK